MPRWARLSVAALAVMVAVTSPWWSRAILRRSEYFAVRQVEVVGARYLAPEDVTRALGLGAGANVWDDLGAVRAAVGRMPGVESATVKRRLPGTLVVTVREQEPVAMAGGPHGLVAVDRDAKALPYDAAHAPVDAPLIGRPDATLVTALATVQQTDPELFADVSAADLSGGGRAIALELGGGQQRGRIRLDVPVDPIALRAVVAVRRDLNARRLGWREIDGRFRGWVVVRPAAGESTVVRN